MGGSPIPVGASNPFERWRGPTAPVKPFTDQNRAFAIFGRRRRGVPAKTVAAVCAKALREASEIGGSRFPYPDIGTPTSRMRLLVQLVEQRLGVFQVGGVEAFSEPAINFGEHCARLVATPALHQNLRK